MRLGDLDALLDKFLRSYTEQEKVGNFQFVACEIKQNFADMVCEQPTIDAVSVVRCKDCTIHGNCVVEDRFALAKIENPFCCVGKRKDGA